jgi:vacuolar protein sorting-associated protein 13A/C
MEIGVEDETVMTLLNFSTHLSEETKTTVNKVDNIFLPEEESKLLESVASLSIADDGEPRILTNQIETDWLERDLQTENEAKMYFEKLNLSPLDVVISFYQREGKSELTGKNKGLFLNAMGATFKTINRAPIKLNAIEMTHAFGSGADIMNKFFIHYKQQIIRNTFALFGSLDILGNPVNLFGNLSTGVKDFFYKPLEGFFLFKSI